MEIPMRAQKLRQLLESPAHLIKLAGAHDAMGARLAESAGFDGVWASSLEICTSQGLPDSGLLSLTDLLGPASAMAQAVDIPVVADCDTGFGGEMHVCHLVRRYEAAGVAGVCIADAQFPKQNSLLAVAHALAPVEEFASKIRVACASRRDFGLVIIARVEALIAGAGQAEALSRARAYVEAGADAVLIHSRSPNPDEILKFVAAWDHPTPLVLVPTTYCALDVVAIERTSRVRMVIYANQGLRAAVAAMKRVFRQILDDGSSLQAEPWIAGLQELFSLQRLSPAGDGTPQPGHQKGQK